MKITDDPRAKLRMWLAHPHVAKCPEPVGLPLFASQRFDSYEAMNAWKRAYMLRIARSGGVSWKK